MTQCTFHDIGPAQRDRRLFEIVERAFALQARVLIFAQNETRASDLDRTLWILKQESFIPHAVVREEREPGLPVAIVVAEFNPNEAEILIADAHCSLEFALAFKVVHEFVDRSSPKAHQACRSRYRSYQSSASVEYSK